MVLHMSMNPVSQSTLQCPPERVGLPTCYDMMQIHLPGEIMGSSASMPVTSTRHSIAQWGHSEPEKGGEGLYSTKELHDLTRVIWQEPNSSHYVL